MLAGEDPPDRGESRGGELGVQVVQEVYGPLSSGVQDPAVGGQEEEGESLPLSRRGNPADLVFPPADLQVIPVRAHQGELALALAVGDPFQASSPGPPLERSPRFWRRVSR